jgi:hypothetical protein
MTIENYDATPTQKAAEIAVKLERGEELTSRQIAECYGMTWQGADMMMNNIAGRLPIVKDKAGKWRKFDTN